MIKWLVPIVIYLIGLSLRLWYGLPSYTGAPEWWIGDEFNTYLLVVQTGYHNTNILLNYCLFTTLVPALLQKATGTDPSLLFNLYACVIVAVLPVVIYLTSALYVSRLYALIAAFYTMIQINFVWIFDYTRSNIALVFLSLVPLILLSKMRPRSKIMWLAPVLCCIVLSHYATAFATIFVLGTGLAVIIASRLPLKKPTLAILATLVALVALSGIWYSTFEGELPLRYGTGLVWNVLIDPGKESSGETVSSGHEQVRIVETAFGATLPDMTIPQKIEFTVSWLSIILMTIGLLTAIRKGIFPYKEYGVLAGVAYATVCLAIVSPELSHYYGVPRTYYQMLVPLAVCLPIGGGYIAEKLRIKTWALTVPLVIIQGLCVYGVTSWLLGATRW